MSEKFQKKKEDFICGHCQMAVIGSGYTNHCPNCLWSKHVDIYPGDRGAKCGGLMEPIELIYEKGKGNVVHKCLSCGYMKKNKLESVEEESRAIALI